MTPIGVFMNVDKYNYIIPDFWAPWCKLSLVVQAIGIYLKGKTTVPASQMPSIFGIAR